MCVYTSYLRHSGCSGRVENVKRIVGLDWNTIKKLCTRHEIIVVKVTTSNQRRVTKLQRHLSTVKETKAQHWYKRSIFYIYNLLLPYVFSLKTKKKENCEENAWNIVDTRTQHGRINNKWIKYWNYTVLWCGTRKMRATGNDFWKNYEGQTVYGWHQALDGGRLAQLKKMAEDKYSWRHRIRDLSSVVVNPQKGRSTKNEIMIRILKLCYSYTPNLIMFPVVDDARSRFTWRKFNGLVQQSFVIDDPLDLNAAVGADNHLWLRHKKIHHQSLSPRIVDYILYNAAHLTQKRIHVIQSHRDAQSNCVHVCLMCLFLGSRYLLYRKGRVVSIRCIKSNWYLLSTVRGGCFWSASHVT